MLLSIFATSIPVFFSVLCTQEVLFDPKAQPELEFSVFARITGAPLARTPATVELRAGSSAGRPPAAPRVQALGAHPLPPDTSDPTAASWHCSAALTSPRPPCSRSLFHPKTAGAWTTHNPRVLELLAGLHVWTPQFLEARLKWRERQPITVLELRAYRSASH